MSTTQSIPFATIIGCPANQVLSSDGISCIPSAAANKEASTSAIAGEYIGIVAAVMIVGAILAFGTIKYRNKSTVEEVYGVPAKSVPQMSGSYGSELAVADIEHNLASYATLQIDPVATYGMFFFMASTYI